MAGGVLTTSSSGSPVSTVFFSRKGPAVRRLCRVLILPASTGCVCFLKLSSAWFCLAAQELKLYMEAPHPPEGREAELSGIRCSQAVSLTTASPRPAQEDDVWPSFNSLTSDTGCCWRLSLFGSLRNPAFPSSASAGGFCSPAPHPLTVRWLLPTRASYS